MNGAIRWTPRAEKDLRQLDRSERGRVIAAVVRFGEERIGDVRRLQDVTPPEFRLRVGDLRVRFGFDEKHGTMVILRVLRRDKAYRR